MGILYWLQQQLNKFAEHPLSLGLCVGFLIGWTTMAMLSHGSFDPGLGVENLIINGLSILLLFAANSKRNDHADASAERHDATQAQLDAIKAHLEEKLK